MKARSNRPGFILPMTLIMIGIVAIVIAAVGGYVSQAARMTRYYLAKDRCRFAAQSAIEQAKFEIQRGFQNYISENFASIQIAPGKAKAYNWFDSVGGDHRTIGTPNPVTIFGTQEYPIRENGCSVWVGLGANLEHESNSSIAIVPVVATAEYECPDGQKVTATIKERFVFGTGQSKVFDNAYFVNNYGWMNGGFTINGEFRANGNVSLKGGCVVNGFVYAAVNTEIPNTLGTVTINSATIKNQSDYRRNASTRSRYDTGNLDELGSYDAVVTSGTISKPTYNADGSIRSGSKTARGKAIVEEQADAVEMPFVSELQPYVDYARDENGTLKVPSTSYKDSNGTTVSVAGRTVNAYNSLTAAGPSGNADLADAGSLLLVGTEANPIEINGPVVVAGDVIIKGYVKGQGTIYAGRNVHIIGDIKYKNPPVWTHTKTGDSARNEQQQNETKDMLGLVAKGNIVVGDSTASSIAQNVNSGSAIAYACDENDSAIGYPSRSYSTTKTVSSGGYRPVTTTTTVNTFSGDYTAVEQINGLSTGVAQTAPGGYQKTSGRFGKVRDQVIRTETIGTGWNKTTKNIYGSYTSYDRHYYETVCNDAIIKNLKSTVYQIDAVMYNNHGVFGSLGASFQINGALVCRDEGLTGNGGTFNWDMRLRRKKDSAVVAKMGLPKGAGDPYVADWIEVPDSMNPLYTAGSGGNQ